MPRLLGVDIPNEKRIDVALRYLYGVGHHVATKALAELAINGAVRAKDLKDDVPDQGQADTSRARGVRLGKQPRSRCRCSRL